MSKKTTKTSPELDKALKTIMTPGFGEAEPKKDTWGMDNDPSHPDHYRNSKLAPRYRVQAHHYTVGGLHDVYEAGELELDAPYQRGFVWPVEKKILLLDSMMRGLGFPPVYMRAYDANLRRKYLEVIDGKQRISTVLGFMNDEFPYNGLYFSQLSGGDQRRFQMMPFPWIAIYDMTDEDAVEIFNRVNYSGVPQEEGPRDAKAMDWSGVRYEEPEEVRLDREAREANRLTVGETVSLQVRRGRDRQVLDRGDVTVQMSKNGYFTYYKGRRCWIVRDTSTGEYYIQLPFSD